MVGECRDVNETSDEAGKLVLLRNSKIDQLRIDGLRNELLKRGVTANNMNEKELCDTPQNYVEDKVPNVTAEETNRKILSGFPHKSKWRTINPNVSQAIEPDNDFK